MAGGGSSGYDFDLLRAGKFDALVETWQDEGAAGYAGINPMRWTAVPSDVSAVPWRNTIWNSYVERQSIYMALPVTEVARLLSKQRWLVTPGIFGSTTSPIYSMNAEWEMVQSAVGAMYPGMGGGAYFGFCAQQAAFRNSQNLVGFCMNGSSTRYVAIIDNAGVEQLSSDITNTAVNSWAKFRIEVTKGCISFYVNEVLIGSYTSRLPSLPMYLGWSLDSGWGATTFSLGTLRVWYELKR